MGAESRPVRHSRILKSGPEFGPRKIGACIRGEGPIRAEQVQSEQFQAGQVQSGQVQAFADPGCCGSRLRQARCLAAATATEAAAPIAAAARTGFPALEAVLAVDGTVASGLEWNRGLLPAPGADDACALGRAALKPAAARLLVLLGLAACFAALGRGVTTIAKELLILGRKREGLPAIAAHELLIFSHISLSSMHSVSAAFQVPVELCWLSPAARDRGRPILPI